MTSPDIVQRAWEAQCREFGWTPTPPVPLHFRQGVVEALRQILSPEMRALVVEGGRRTQGAERVDPKQRIRGYLTRDILFSMGIRLDEAWDELVEVERYEVSEVKSPRILMTHPHDGHAEGGETCIECLLAERAAYQASLADE